MCYGFDPNAVLVCGTMVVIIIGFMLFLYHLVKLETK